MGRKTSLSIRVKVAGALHSLNGMTIHSNNPLFVLKPVLYVSSVVTRILLYPARISNLLNNDFPRSSSRIDDILGSGVTSRTVYSLSFRYSCTILREPSFFLTVNVGDPYRD